MVTADTWILISIFGFGIAVLQLISLFAIANRLDDIHRLLKEREKE